MRRKPSHCLIILGLVFVFMLPGLMFLSTSSALFQDQVVESFEDQQAQNWSPTSCAGGGSNIVTPAARNTWMYEQDCPGAGTAYVESPTYPSPAGFNEVQWRFVIGLNYQVGGAGGLTLAVYQIHFYSLDLVEPASFQINFDRTGWAVPGGEPVFRYRVFSPTNGFSPAVAGLQGGLVTTQKAYHEFVVTYTNIGTAAALLEVEEGGTTTISWSVAGDSVGTRTVFRLNADAQGLPQLLDVDNFRYQVPATGGGTGTTGGGGQTSVSPFEPTFPKLFNCSVVQFEDTRPQAANAIYYNWQFGDGESVKTTSGIVEHNYTKPGDYTANVAVQDKSGAIQIFTTNVKTGGTECILGQLADIILPIIATLVLVAAAVSIFLGKRLGPRLKKWLKWTFFVGSGIIVVVFVMFGKFPFIS